MDEALGHARYVLGLVGSSLAVSFYGSPLASLAHVIRSRSSDVLPFPIILTSFIGKTFASNTQIHNKYWLFILQYKTE